MTVLIFCVDAQTDLDIRCSHMQLASFSHDVSKIMVSRRIDFPPFWTNETTFSSFCLPSGPELGLETY